MKHGTFISMKSLAVFLIITSLLLIPFSEVSARNHKKPVTPYGDFCKKCSHYGKCKSAMSVEDSRKAMVDYYQKKGLKVEINSVKGRFIKASIKEKNKIVDIIIFDRKSGRIRSIY
jgi:hypothetical protein